MYEKLQNKIGQIVYLKKNMSK